MGEDVKEMSDELSKEGWTRSGFKRENGRQGIQFYQLKLPLTPQSEAIFSDEHHESKGYVQRVFGFGALK